MKTCVLFINNSVSKTNKLICRSSGEWGSLTQMCLSLATGRSKDKTTVSECQALSDLSIFQCVGLFHL